MTLAQLKGTWLTQDGNCSMWISDDMKKIVIISNMEIVVSENTNFLYDEERNECRISESVVLRQLFPDGDICIQVSVDEKCFKLIFLPSL